jgi:aminoglycoside 6'-N-acetyltransferase I
MVDPMTVRIVPFTEISDTQRQQAAGLLVRGFAHSPGGWSDTQSARGEVDEFFASPDRAAFAAISGDTLVGWVGRIEHSAHAWELHPLVVEPARQRSGVGTLLVATLEAAARDAGVCTIWLGADDDFGGTNLFGTSLYPNVLERLSQLSPAAGHPFTFYRDRGYSVVGILPDAAGAGSHDILMAKHIV